MTLCVSSVPVSAPALMSRKTFEALGAVPDVLAGTVYFRALNRTATLWLSPCGHLSVRIDEWPQQPFKWPLSEIPEGAPDVIHPAAFSSSKSALKKLSKPACSVPHASSTMASSMEELYGEASRVRDCGATGSALLLSDQPPPGAEGLGHQDLRDSEYGLHNDDDGCSVGGPGIASAEQVREPSGTVPTSFRNEVLWSGRDPSPDLRLVRTEVDSDAKGITFGQDAVGSSGCHEEKAGTSNRKRQAPSKRDHPNTFRASKLLLACPTATIHDLACNLHHRGNLCLPGRCRFPRPLAPKHRWHRRPSRSL